MDDETNPDAPDLEIEAPTLPDLAPDPPPVQRPRRIRKPKPKAPKAAPSTDPTPRRRGRPPGSTSRPSPGKSAPLADRTAPGSAELHEKIIGTYSAVAFLIDQTGNKSAETRSVADQRIAVLQQYAGSSATSLVKLGEDYPPVAKLLDLALTGGAIGTVLMVHINMAMALRSIKPQAEG